jgi:UPF0755 protein
MLKRLAIFFLVLLLTAGGAGGWAYVRLTSAYRGFEGPEVFVALPAGTSMSGIAARLASAGVVPDALTFRLAARISGQERHLQAGEYRFTEAATPGDVVARLARGDVFTRPITVPEGLTIPEVAAIVERAGLGTADEFRQAASDGAIAVAFDPEAASLEGFLFPDTYALPRSAGAEAVVRAMVERFGVAFDVDLRRLAAAQHMNARTVVTLASLVEKETARDDERAVVAAVYRNRLRIGMPMQCDPTVIYAKMLAGTWQGNLTRKDLQMDSPYNTYRYAGLPPGPIASPGRASLEAALRPADVPYLYFVSRNDGSHVFASTLPEHNRNVARFQGRGRD